MVVKWVGHAQVGLGTLFLRARETVTPPRTRVYGEGLVEVVVYVVLPGDE